MLSFKIPFVSLLSLASALTFTEPSSDTTLDPTQAMTVTWTSDSSDPATFDLVVNQPSGIFKNMKVQSDISTSRGTFQVPANTIAAYGSQFQFVAQDASGNTIGSSADFTIAIGSNQVVTVNGVPVLATSLTATATGGAGSTAPVDGTVTATVTSASATGSESSAASVTSEASESAETTSASSTTGFSTRTTSRTSSMTSTGSATSAAATSTTSANAQPRLGSSSQMVLGAAGLFDWDDCSHRISKCVRSRAMSAKKAS